MRTEMCGENGVHCLLLDMHNFPFVCNASLELSL